MRFSALSAAPFPRIIVRIGYLSTLQKKFIQFSVSGSVFFWPFFIRQRLMRNLCSCMCPELLNDCCLTRALIHDVPFSSSCCSNRFKAPSVAKVDLSIVSELRFINIYSVLGISAVLCQQQEVVVEYVSCQQPRPRTVLDYYSPPCYRYYHILVKGK